MKSSEKPPSEKAEFAEAYEKEFEDREKEKKNLFETHKDRKPSETGEKQTELKDFTEGGKFEGRIKKERIENLKKQFAKEIYSPLSSFFGADETIENTRKTLESSKWTTREIQTEKRGYLGKISNLFTAESKKKKIGEEAKEEVKKETEKAMSKFPTEEDLRKIMMKRIKEIKGGYKERGLPEKEIETIYNKIKEQEEKYHKERQEEKIRRELKEIEKKTEKAEK
ncbi:hypothetical protein KJ636_00275 [Patescibacteria group bacterium]|nr:hypothetical protein [Patescibacteria group bacterium]